MSTWLARLKTHNTPGTGATKPTKPTQDTPEGGFVGFVACPQGRIQKIDGAVANPETPAANAPAIDPDRWAWPHSSAMNGQELDTLMARQALFCQRGASAQDAERLADRLVNRDRSSDDRRLCLECRHQRGEGRCGNARAAGVHADLARDLVLTLQRCHGYEDARLPMGVIADAAPPTPAAAPKPPRTPSGPSWRELDRAYLAHHQQCSACQCAGRGYGQRCAIGMQLWTVYSSMNSDLKE